jgi:hypothetical protein
MDLMLFPTYALPSTLYAHAEEARRPVISAAVFAEWPEHMRREFAALTAEAGIADADVRERTGITPKALERARQSKCLFALSYAEFDVLDEEGARHRNQRAMEGEDAQCVSPVP